MNFDISPKVQALAVQLQAFMAEEVLPKEALYERQVGALQFSKAPPVMAALKAKARTAGLWNLFLPDSERGAGLSNLEYAPLCEIV